MGTIARSIKSASGTINFLAGTTAKAQEVNDDFNEIYNEFNGNIQNDNIASDASIASSKLAVITDAGKVSGLSFTGLASIPSDAGIIPSANLPAEEDVNLTTDVVGVLPVANGGTGQSTAQGAIDGILPDQSGHSGEFLTTDGANSSWAELSSDWVLEGVTSSNHAEGSTYTSNVTIDPTKRYQVFVELYTTNAGGNPPEAALEHIEFNEDTGSNYIQAAGTTKTSSISVATGSAGSWERANFYLDFIEIVKTALSVKMAVVRDGTNVGVSVGSTPFNLNGINAPKTFFGVYQGASSPSTMRLQVHTGATCTSTSKIYLYSMSLS